MTMCILSSSRLKQQDHITVQKRDAGPLTATKKAVDRNELSTKSATVTATIATPTLATGLGTEA